MQMQSEYVKELTLTRGVDAPREGVREPWAGEPDNLAELVAKS
jgi:hypothetical protein